MSHLIRIYTACHAVTDHCLSPLFTKNERVQIKKRKSPFQKLRGERVNKNISLTVYEYIAYEAFNGKQMLSMNLPSGHMTFIQRRFNVDATSTLRRRCISPCHHWVYRNVLFQITNVFFRGD